MNYPVSSSSTVLSISFQIFRRTNRAGVTVRCALLTEASMDSWVGNSSSMCGSVCCGRMRLLHFLFYCVEPPVGVNVSVGLGELLLGVSPTLEVAPLLVVAPLEVAPPLEVAQLM